MELEQLKVQYFREQIEKGIRDIFSRQLEATQEGVYSAQADRKREKRTGRLRSGRSGALLSALQSPVYSVTDSGGGVEASAQLPVYSRFLDMKRKGNKRIYNRPLYGGLYRELLSAIKYEFREWMARNRDAFAEQTAQNGGQ